MREGGWRSRNHEPCCYHQHGLTLFSPDTPSNECSNGNSWEFNTCGQADFLGWADAADAIVQQASGQVAADFGHIVYVLPTVTTCQWAGMGYIGCDGSFECRAWIGGTCAIDAMVHSAFAVRSPRWSSPAVRCSFKSPLLVFLPTLQATLGAACRLTCTSRATTSTCSTRAPWWAAPLMCTPTGPTPWATAAPTAASTRPTPGR